MSPAAAVELQFNVVPANLAATRTASIFLRICASVTLAGENSKPAVAGRASSNWGFNAHYNVGHLGRGLFSGLHTQTGNRPVSTAVAACSPTVASTGSAAKSNLRMKHL